MPGIARRWRFRGLGRHHRLRGETGCLNRALLRHVYLHNLRTSCERLTDSRLCQCDVIYYFYTQTFVFVQSYKFEHRSRAFAKYSVHMTNCVFWVHGFVYQVERCTLFLHHCLKHRPTAFKKIQKNVEMNCMSLGRPLSMRLLLLVIVMR